MFLLVLVRMHFRLVLGNFTFDVNTPKMFFLGSFWIFWARIICRRLFSARKIEFAREAREFLSGKCALDLEKSRKISV